MSWKETNAMDERIRFVVDYESGNWSMAELCRRYGISRPCGYKWLERYRTGGLEGLENQSCRPHHCPHRLDESTEDFIVKFREKRMNCRLPQRSGSW